MEVGETSSSTTVGYGDYQYSTDGWNKTWVVEDVGPAAAVHESPNWTDLVLAALFSLLIVVTIVSYTL